MLEHLALGRGRLDRLAHRRSDRAWCATALQAPTTRIIGVSGSDVAVVDDVLIDVREWCTTATEYLLLGAVDDVVCFAAGLHDVPVPMASLRSVGATLCDDDAALATTAVALHQWHATHTHCPRCGAPTTSAMHGWERHCTADGSAHFPRTDPAVIVAITSPDDELLLARQRVWPEGRYSIIAGYVEPGETSEHAVAREALEEVGLSVDNLTYLGSQPWPFPASLMLCYRASAADRDIRVDGEEIVEAAWWTREALATAVSDGTLLLPSTVSVARRAIEDWFGSPLAE